MLIGMMGFAGAGKDASAGFLTYDHGFTRVAFADTLREMAYALDPWIEVYDKFERLTSIVDRKGWDDAKQIPDVRRTLQRMGTEAGRDVLGRNIWVDTAFDSKIIPALNAKEKVVITDVRFPNEIHRLQAAGGILWRVERPGMGPRNGHVSETAWTKFTPDVVIVNDGTLDDLGQKVRALVRHPRGVLVH